LTVDIVYAMHADPSPWSRVVNAVRFQSLPMVSRFSGSR